MKKIKFRITGFAKDKRGVAMLEFGLVLPLLLVMLFGGIEVTRYILFHQKIENATNLFGDDVTRMNYSVVPCAGDGSLEWIKEKVLKVALPKFDTEGDLVVSAIEGHADDVSDESKPVKQQIVWQWKPGAKDSKIGSKGSTPATGVWPASFKKAPDQGGMFDGDRIIAVEVYYDYNALFPFYSTFTGGKSGDAITNVYKAVFFRSRVGSMNKLGC